jgi:hypothetical protein
MSQTRKQKILGDVKRARRRRTLATTAIIAVLMVTIVVAIIFLTPHTPPNPLIGAPISAALSNQLSGVSNTTLVAVGPGQGVTPLNQVSGSPLNSSGKPEVLYIGAEYCPYCAAERWGIIVALSKFGSFSGLTYMLSSSTDNPSNVATFSFRSAIYTSNYISFVSVEESDRNGAPLQTPTSQEQSIFSQYDTTGGIPFVDVANKYVDPGGSQYPVQVILNQNWTQIGSQLDTPNRSVAQAIDGTANTLITAICNVDGKVPGNICGLTLAPPTQAPFTVNNMPPYNMLNTINTSDIFAGENSWRNSLQLTL